MKEKTRKNAIVLASATAGAAAGTAVLPVVGTLIGWTVVGGIARAAVGGFEKDANKWDKLNAGGYYLHQQRKKLHNR